MNNIKNLELDIPQDALEDALRVYEVTSTLEKAGFEVFLVGGCVRDLVMGRIPKDWDLTTNAKPAQIEALFEKTVYENNFGTVAVCLPLDVPVEADSIQVDVKHETSEEGISSETKEPDVSRDTSTEEVTHVTNTQKYFITEVTPYRLEAKYTDFRHPDEVVFSENLEDDLKRRDFNMNAMVMSLSHTGDILKGHIKDLYGGLKDIEEKTIKTVGEADKRFSEDALRMLRAVRFASQLGFSVSHETAESIIKNAHLIKNVSAERIRDEFVKMINSTSPAAGMVMLEKFGLLEHVIPEFIDGIGCEQGGAHLYDVWSHLLHALQHAADKGWSTEIRLAALFHDIGKPKTKRSGVKKPTFYGHEVVGARMARKIMQRLKFPKKETEMVEKLVRNHMFFSDTEQITLSAVRRIIAKVSRENIWDLMNVRECDRVGMKKKEAPYRLRKYFAMIEQALRDPISVKQLKIDGKYLMDTLHMKPGPRMGWILNALLEEVLEDPEKNTVEKLGGLAIELEKLDDEQLKSLGEQGKEKKEELEEGEIEKLHKKHGVRTNKQPDR